MIESVIVLIGNFILPYLVLSLLAMLLVELIAAFVQLRGLTLKQFIQHMLGDPNGKGITGEFYRHHLIASLSHGKRVPSYIPSRLFAIALADTVRKYAEDGALSQTIKQLTNQELRQGMQAILQYAFHGRELTAVQFWYNTVMDAASGAYRLRTLFMVMIVASAIVVPVNFDAIRISNHVARRSLIEKILESRLQSDMKVDTTKAQSSATLPDLASLQVLAFPIGWSGELTELNMREDRQPGWFFNWLIMKVAGLLTSVFAIMIGAPFLFDLLNRFMVVRSTVKPWETLEEPEPLMQSVVPATPAPQRTTDD
jgi:hypothetical protein